MAKKAVRQLVTYIATLAVIVMRIIVDNRRLPAAGHCHRREGGPTRPEKGRGVAVELTKLEEHDVEVGAHLGRIDRVNRPKTHLLPDAQRDAVSLCFEAAPESQFNCPEACYRC
jgi:hypothetical protein